MSDTRREDLLDKMADYVLAEGLGAASLRPLAKAVGTSDRMLLYYFEDKSDLLAAVLSHIGARLQPLLEAAAAPQPLKAKALLHHVHDTFTNDGMWLYMQLWLEIASRAARGDETCKAVGQSLGEGFIEWLAPQLVSGSKTEAYDVLASFEGRVLLKSIGLE